MQTKIRRREGRDCRNWRVDDEHTDWICKALASANTLITLMLSVMDLIKIKRYMDELLASITAMEAELKEIGETKVTEDHHSELEVF